MEYTICCLGAAGQAQQHTRLGLPNHTFLIVYKKYLNSDRTIKQILRFLRKNEFGVPRSQLSGFMRMSVCIFSQVCTVRVWQALAAYPLNIAYIYV